MKITKFFIIALIVMILACISTTSATDTFNQDLSTNTTDNNAISISDENQVLNEGNTITVEGGGDGKISAAVSNANSGDTIYIKNGQYSEDTITFTKTLNIVGETQDGVIITKNSGNTDLFVSTSSINLSFSNFSIKDSSRTGGNGLLRFGDGNVNWINCTFNNLSSKYGAMHYTTSDTVNIENCIFENVREESNSPGTGAIYYSSTGTHTIKNCLFNNCGYVPTSSGQMYGLIYSAGRSGSLTIEGTIISNCYGVANSLIRASNNLYITNSKIFNNTIKDRETYVGDSMIYISSSGNLYMNQTLLANNTAPKTFIYTGSSNNIVLNYNNIYGNSFGTEFCDNYNTASSQKDFNYNYWGENGKPSDVIDELSQITIIKDGSNYKLSNGDDLTVIIPGINDNAVDPNTTFVSPDGNDNNTGSSDAPVKTIKKAVELATLKNGEIIITEGIYTENNIELNSNISYTITGKGNVVIDGNASSNSIFIMHGGQATFTNIRFTNNKPKYGGAIFINYGTGTSRNTIDINVTIDKCVFEDINSTSRGGAVYAWYTTGNIIIKNSVFKNIDSGSFGAVTVGYSAYENGLNLEISNSIFENNNASNAAAAYLQAKNILITGSSFINNTAKYNPGAIYIYNGTAVIDNCKLCNNSASGAGAAIQSTIPSKSPVTNLTITNSIIENNYGTNGVSPAIYMDMTRLNISYSSIINNLSIETRTAAGYDSIYGQGVVIANNNWWGCTNPSTKVKGEEITIDNWVIMNVEVNASQIVIYDEVQITVDFNHVNTTSGEIENLTGGVIPIESYTVNFSTTNGTITPSTVEIKKGESKSVIYEVQDPNAIVTVTYKDIEIPIDFSAGADPYFGIIYLSQDGNDKNNGSINAPVATLAKAMALALNKHGSGEIIVSEGIYNGSDFTINKNLTITGQGNVIFNGENKTTSMFNAPSGANVDKLELNNLIITNVNRGYGAFVYNYGVNEVILNNITYAGNTNDRVTLITSYVGTLTVKNSKISNNTVGGIIVYSSKDNLTVINSIFENNIVNKDTSVYGIIHASGNGNIIVKDSLFKNNTVRQNVIAATGNGNNVYINNTEISQTTSDVGSGAAISAKGNLIINNSKFTNNKANKNGGAIYIDSYADAKITNSIFANNSAGSSDKGDIIYAKGKLTINYSILLNNNSHKTLYNAGEYVINAQYNWWGTNDDPKTLNGVDQYYDYDEWEYVNCEYPDTSNWIVMNITTDMINNTVKLGDKVEITVDFTKYMNTTGGLQDLDKILPEFTITATSQNGQLDANEITVKNNMAKITYTATQEGQDNLDIVSGLTVPIDINVRAPGAIYVSVDGNDANDGSSQDNAVATIQKAIEIADNKIIILNGTYVINDAIIINKDLDITGKDIVVLDGNSSGMFENTAKINFTNIIFTNSKLGFGGVVKNDGEVIFENCTFHSNTATGTSSGIINNKGTMIVNNSKFHDNIASRGEISSQTGSKLIINNSEFYYNNVGKTGNVYGVIYSNSADTVIENTIFRDNAGKAGAVIYATRGSSSTTGTLNVINCTFNNNTASYTGGAIFAGRTPTNIKNSVFTNNKVIPQSLPAYGGAIYQTIDDPLSQMTIDHCIFINNTADNGAALYVNTNQGTFTVTNSIILNKENDTSYALAKKDGATTVITAENNYWGNNSGANSQAPVSVIITLDVTTTPDGAQTGDEVTITARFSQDVPNGAELQFISTSKNLNQIVSVKNKVATVNYVLDSDDNDVSIYMGGRLLETIPFAIPDVIYVMPGASDSNIGSLENPVGTIERALKLAVKGNIVLLNGTHKVSDLGIISNNLNITGQGKVIIDAQNNNAILCVGTDAKIVIKNVIMINGYGTDGSGGLLSNNNELTLINCTLANSSAGQNNGGAIYNVGKLTIINSTINHNTAKEGGAIWTNNDLSKNPIIIIQNSIFENNIATGKDNYGGGAIFAQELTGLTITNTTFANNKAQTTSSGGAIFISHSDTLITITDSEFISNHANGNSNVGGGAIYMVGTSNYERKGTLTISNTLFDSNTCDNDGGAIYVRATTLKVENSVLINNNDMNRYAIYGYGTEQVNPSITANNNWWGSNDNPNKFIGGYRFTPRISTWAIMTVTNSSAFIEGENVTLTVNINQYTTGTENGTLAKPISVKLPVTITTTTGDINGILNNGEFTTNYLVPNGFNYISATLNDETIVLYVVPTETTVELINYTVKQGENVEFNIKVLSNGTIVNKGIVELYVDDELIATIDVIDGIANKKILITKTIGIYNLTAKYNDNTLIFVKSNATATLNVSGINNIVTKENFFDFFDASGSLLNTVPFDELIFKGEFKDLGVNIIYLHKAMSIIGDNATFTNIACSIIDNNIKLSNIKFNSDKVNYMENYGACVLVYANNIELNNITVNYTTENDIESYGIYVLESKKVNITQSKVYFDSNNNGNTHTYAMHIRDSEDVCVKESLINATLPSLDVDFSYWGSIDTDLVLVIGVQEGKNIKIMENTILSNVKSASGDYATLDTIMVYGTTNLLISHNNISETDFSGQGIPGYSNVVDLYAFNTALIEYNNIYVKTTTGIEGKGTAYPIQLTGPYTGLVIDHNNLTAIAQGPALGIYSQNYDGITDITVTNNYINVTGLATGNYYALVSGMELQDTVAKVYNNTIYSYNVGDGDDGLFGISYAQSTSGNHNFDIQNNTIHTDGKYAIYLLSAQNSIVTENILYANELKGDESVKINSGSGNIIIDNYPLFPVNVIIDANNVPAGKDNIITITVSNATGNITLTINNNTYTANLTDGIAKITIPATELVLGENTVSVTYNGDEYYKVTTNTTSFNVTKAKSNIIITTTDLTIQNDVNVTVNITGATGNITIITDNIKNEIPLNNGIATYTIKSIKAGKHIITVIYLGDNTHEFATNSTKFTIDKITTIIEANSTTINYGQIDKLNIKLSPQINTTISTIINGKKQIINIINGIGEIDITGMAVGNHSIILTYSGDDYYETSEKTINIQVNPIDANLKASTSNINVSENAIINIEINTQATGNINVKLGDAIYQVTIINGKGNVTISDLPAGEYTAYITFQGDKQFKPSEITTKFIVYKVKLPENSTTISMEIPEGTTSPEFTINLPTDATGNLTITVDGIKYTKQIINGTATVTVNDLTVGNHTISAAYTGDKKYNGFATLNKTMTIPKATIPGGEDALNITIPEGSESPNFSINLPKDATGNLTVTVDDKDTYTQALINGSANINVPKLTQGDHKVNVCYTGDIKYSLISKNATVHIPIVNIINNKDMVISYTQSATYSITVTKDGKAIGADENVTITLNGNNYNLKTDINGSVSFKIPMLNPGKHTITATYNEIKVSNNINVNGIVKAKNMKVKKSAKVLKVKVTLNKVNGVTLIGKQVTLKLNGKIFKAKTNSKGVAVFKLKKKVIKKLKAGKKYPYQAIYINNIAKYVIKVKK
ncbi:MAG: hypothetical protein E7Z80_00140 [Methanobrevibacter thaueri]|nr:hypothetical protein [Methanobrevibacter thaueri]